MSRITYFPRYTTQENVVTNTTLHLFSQINQHSPDRLQQVLGGLLGGDEIPLTFEELCNSLNGLAKEYEIHLLHVVEDYVAYCAEMELLPDRRKWLRIVPCGETFELNQKWNLYYQPTARSYSKHEFIGIYNQKSVRLIGRVAAIYDSKLDAAGKMQLKLSEGIDRPEFRKRIENMVADSKQELGWELDSDYRFFCADRFLPTNFEKTSWGGIQGARFQDISEQVEKADTDDLKLAELLCNQKWE
jgi:hypothetical protein